MTDEKWKARARYTLDVADHEPDCTCTHCVYAIGVAAALAEAAAEEREACQTVALEQRCERGTPWDRACVAIAAAIGAREQKP